VKDEPERNPDMITTNDAEFFPAMVKRFRDNAALHARRADRLRAMAAASDSHSRADRWIRDAAFAEDAALRLNRCADALGDASAAALIGPPR
jgi:hypothetical protein